ncbi:WD40-repeat-containing domain protein [Aspergillus recurvatus]
MAVSSYRGDFFQTTSALDEQKRKEAKSSNTNGSPIRLQSKILAVQPDPFDFGSVYVAQSGGTVMKIVLATGETTSIFKGPTAPVTSLCFSPNGRILFAGCWDKTIWSWDVNSTQRKLQYEGHTDFVRSVVTTRVNGQDLLVSGGADAQILVFDISSGQRLHVLKGHAKGIQNLLLDSLTLDNNSTEQIIFSAGSDREIRQFNLAKGSQDLTGTEALLAHETNIYKLYFDQDGDLWTASADKTTKCLVREDGWKANLTLTHPDYVKDVVVDERGGWVITACRDEEVRVWNRSTGQLYHTFSGHYEEVTGLVLLGTTLVSVSIDATIRQWSLKPDDLRNAVALATKPPADEQSTNPESMLTEEEERELAELLEED